jgi:type I restriction enzyme, S subunit
VQVLSVYIENFETIFSVKNNIQALRNKVLELAVHGKLVEQDSDVEPASVLVNKIQAERNELVKEGKLKKQKPFITIDKKEIPFALPNGWEWVRFNDIALFKKGPFGSSITKSMFVPRGKNTYKVYEQKNAIQKDNTLGEYYISEEKFNELQNFEVFPGDILVSCAGTIGETYILPEEIEQGIINQALMRINLSNLIEKDFFLMFFKTVLNSHITSKSKGSAIKNIPPLDVLKNIPFAVPSYNEQKRIIEKYKCYMSKIDELKELLQKKEHLMELFPKAVFDAIVKCQTGGELRGHLQLVIENFETIFQTPTSLQELRNVVRQLAIEGKLVPQNQNDEPASELIKIIQSERDNLVKGGKIKKQKPLKPIQESDIRFEIPDSWEWERLGNIVNLIMGQSPDGNTVKENPINGIEFHQGKSNFGKKVINNSGKFTSDPKKCCPKDSLLISVRAPVGTVNFTDREICIGRGLSALIPFKGIHIDYLYNAITSLEDWLVENATGTTFKAITGEVLSNLLLPIPPNAEQQRIVQKVELIMDLIDQMENKLKKKVDLVEKMASM